MADIVQLQAFELKRVRRPALPEVAEIVIFPGVRIERKSFSLADRLVRGDRVRPTSHGRTFPAKRED